MIATSHFTSNPTVLASGKALGKYYDTRHSTASNGREIAWSTAVCSRRLVVMLENAEMRLDSASCLHG
jgi:hypothetical protein